MKTNRSVIKGNIDSKIKEDAQKLAKELNIHLYEFMEDALKRHIKKTKKNLPKLKRAKTQEVEKLILSMFNSKI